MGEIPILYEHLSEQPYQVCRRCVMDTSDRSIRFDETGLCAYCQNFDLSIVPRWQDMQRDSRLSEVATKIRAQRGGRAYDCIIGVSGGLDSSYTAYLAVREMKLRPLLYHVDAGWNTAQAVRNIGCLVDGLGVDLHTDVIDWEEMADLQSAFLHAQVADQDMPQDVAFFSSLYGFAKKENIKYILTGANFSTECIREPEAWGAYPGIDKRLIKDIHRRFGKRALRTFPIVDILEYRLLHRYLYGFKIVNPLNLVPFDKAAAEATLSREFGWSPFQHKHHESRFTRFFEDYWLPRKFGFDKRRAHFSSLIVTGQMTREKALVRLEKSEMDDLFQENELKYIEKKLGMASGELQVLFNTPSASVRDHKNKHLLIAGAWRLLRFIGLEERLLR
ncbi:MAG: N-acetyl sugar amidotransferase [Hyphomicrobiales bacterium]